MKGIQPFTLLIMAVLSLAQTASKADQIAVVIENNLNVRGKPSFSGEVITQLQKGEKVVVLEEITLSKPKAGEPKSWRRIRMPANTPVWVFAPFVDPNSNAVSVSRLNLRAGPGENYSIVGRLERGQTVQDIRTVDDWIEIETPNNAEAFVASHYLVLEEAAPTPEPTPTPENDIEPASEENPAVPEESPEVAPTPVPIPESETPTAQAESEATRPEPPREEIPTTPVDETSRPNPALEPTDRVPTPTAVPIILDEKPAPPAVIIVPESPRRRIVRREGIVRSTRSIQAPTYFELVSKDTGKAINYLHATKDGMDLKAFRGKTIIVTGEEGIESRWPKKPILRIETLELAP